MIIDSITVIIFTKVPIYSYNIVDSNKVRVYNAIGLRVWQCNKNYDDDLKVDLFYNNGYTIGFQNTTNGQTEIIKILESPFHTKEIDCLNKINE